MNKNFPATNTTIYFRQRGPSPRRRQARNVERNRFAAPPEAAGLTTGGMVRPLLGDGSPACPVRPLGILGSTTFFIDPIGQLRAIRASSLFRWSTIAGLFLGDMRWAAHRFPSVARKRMATHDFNVSDCASWLIGQCGRAALYWPGDRPFSMDFVTAAYLPKIH
jgi:hypothetical protein